MAGDDRDDSGVGALGLRTTNGTCSAIFRMNIVRAGSSTSMNLNKFYLDD